MCIYPYMHNRHYAKLCTYHYQIRQGCSLMANPIISIINSFRGGNTTGDNGAPSASGTVSNTIIGAAEASKSQATNTTNASQNTRPTPGRKNYGRKDDERDESAGAQALTQSLNSSSSTSSSKSSNWRNSSEGVAISLGTATDSQKITAMEKGATAQNVGFTNADAVPSGKYINSSGKLADTSELLKNATVERTTTSSDGKQITVKTKFNDLTPEEQSEYDIDAFTDSVIRENLQKQQKANVEISSTIAPDVGAVKYQRNYQDSGNISANQKSRQEERIKILENARDDLVIGNLWTTIESLIWNPDGSFNFRDNLFEQIGDYDEADNSGNYRAQKAISAAVEIPSYFIGGGVIGSGTKIVQIGINKLGATKIGGKIVDVATTPIVNPASIVNPITKVTSGTNEALDIALKRVETPSISAGISKIASPQAVIADIMGAKKGVNAIDNFAKTKLPAIIEATTTPTAAAVNIGTVVYGADVASRIASQPTTEKKIEQAAAIALKEIPFGAVGAITGYGAVDRMAAKLSTIGKTEIPFDKIGVKGIPLGDYTTKSLQTSFEQNKLIPEPFKIARTENPYYPKTSASLNPDATNYIEAWHATGNGQYFGKHLTVGKSESELSGIYTAPKLVSHFLGESSYTPKPSLFVREFGRSPESKAINFRVAPKVKILDWSKAARDAGKNPDEVLRDPDLRKKVGDAYIARYSNLGDITAPMMKKEYEAIITPGSEFRRLRRKYYTTYEGRVIPIEEYKLSFHSQIERSAKEKGTALGEALANKLSSRLEFKQEKITAPKIKSTSVSSSYRGKTKPPQVPAYSSYHPANFETVKLPHSYTVSHKLPSEYKLTPASSLSPISSSVSYVASSVSSLTSSIKKPTSSSISKKAGKATSISYNYGGYKPSIISPGYSKKKEETKGKDPAYYKALRTGRIDHLSIKDPLEFFGTGKSMTNRTRPDRVFSKELLYITEGQIGTKKPKGRKRK